MLRTAMLRLVLPLRSRLPRGASAAALFLACLTAGGPAGAHPLAIAEARCPTGYRWAVVGHFAFSQDQLIAYRALRLASGAPGGVTCPTAKTCGIIDDWFWANELAHEAPLAPMRSAAAASSTGAAVLPVVRGPDSFLLNTDLNRNGIADHHDQYRFHMGLFGDYMGCRASTTAPVVKGLRTSPARAARR